MNLRFNILEIASHVDQEICELTPLISIPNSVDITVIIEGVETKYLVAQSSYEIAIPLTNAWDSALVYININKALYNSYTNIIEVYGYDLGSYANDSFNSISNGFDIVLIKADYRTVQEADPTNPNYIPYALNLAYSSFIALRKPLTKEIHYYKTNSCNGLITYRDASGTTISVGANGVICSEDDYYISQLTESYTLATTCNCGDGDSRLLSSCESSLFKIIKWVYIPKVNTSFITDSCEDECTNILLNNSTINMLDLSEITSIYVDDTLISPIQFVELVQRLYEIGTIVSDQGELQGQVKAEDIQVINDVVDFTTSPIEVTNASFGYEPIYRYEWSSFKTPEVGDYKFAIVFIVKNDADEIVLACQTIHTVQSKHWFWYEKQSDCNIYKVSNKSFDTITFTISKLDYITGVFSQVSVTTIPPCNILEVTINTDGVYKFSATRLGYNEEIVYPVISYCNLQNCWLNYQKNIVCCSPRATCQTKEVYDYLVLSNLIYMFIALLNEVYNFATIFDAFNQSELEKLSALDELLNRINTEYCNTCNTVTQCSTNIIVSCSLCTTY